MRHGHLNTDGSLVVFSSRPLIGSEWSNQRALQRPAVSQPKHRQNVKEVSFKWVENESRVVSSSSIVLIVIVLRGINKGKFLDEVLMGRMTLDLAFYLLMIEKSVHSPFLTDGYFISLSL